MSALQKDRPRPVHDGLVGRQLLGILRLELRRSFLGRRSVGLYFLAFAPVAIMALWAMVGLSWEKPPFDSMQDATFTIFARLFNSYLRIAIFLSTLLIFMSLFRSEILEKSLHYYLLTPVRRDVLVAGKYIAALIASWTAFLVGTAALNLLFYVPWGPSEMSRFFFQGPGLGNLVAYLATALMGVAGYGAVFLLIGIYFKNPVVPGVLVWLWEVAIPVLPAVLQKVSVIFYLKALYPVPPQEEAGCAAILQYFRVVAEPPEPWVAVVGFLLFTAAVLVVAGWRARHMEVAYTSE